MFKKLNFRHKKLFKFQFKLNVAVKFLRESLLNESKNDFLSEITYMCSLNNKNLTKLHGIVLTTSQVIMVTELAPMGSLLNFIKTNSENILLTILHSYSCQISAGMEYLESKKLIHRDLAVRNILLFTSDKIKICDFGMMRRLNDKNEYFKIEANSKIPYAWYPPESLRKKIFSIKSDVWTFGVTLWEIYSFGERPWLNLKSNQVNLRQSLRCFLFKLLFFYKDN
jgi:activated CDC42 kinase 1